MNWDFRHTKDASIIIMTVNEDSDKLRKSPKKEGRRPQEYLQSQQTDRLSGSRVDPPIETTTAEGSIASELTHAGTISSSRCVFVNHSLAHPGKVSSRPGSNARGFVNHNKTIT